MKEIWKPVKGYECQYEVSSFGRVKSLARTKIIKGGGVQPVCERILKYGIYKNSYAVVVLCNPPSKRTCKVHRLVLEAFIGVRPIGFDGSHIDGNKHNNNIKNLCWESKKDNSKRKRNHGTFPSGVKNGNSKLTEDKVVKIRELYESGYWTQEALGRWFNVRASSIGNIISKRTWRHI